MSEQVPAEKETQLTSLLEVMSSALGQCKPATISKLNDQAGFQPGTVTEVIAKAQLLLTEPQSPQLTPPAELNLLVSKIWEQALSFASTNKPVATPISGSEIDKDLLQSDDIEAIKKQITSLRKLNSSLESQLKSKISSEQLLQKNLGKTRIEIATLKSSQLNTKMLRESAEKEKLHADQYHKQFEAAKTEIYHLCKQLEQQKKDHQQQLKAEQSKVSQLEQQLSEVKTEVESNGSQLNGEVEKLTTALTDSQSLVSSLQEEVETLRTQTKELKTQLKGESTSQQQSIVEQASLKNQLTAAAEQNNQLKSQLEETQAALNKLQKEFKAIQDAEAKLKQAATTQQHSLVEKQQELTNLQQQLSELVQASSTLQQTEQALASAEQKLSELENYKKQGAQLQQQLADAQQRVNALEASQQTAQDEINRLTQASERLASQEQALSTDIATLRDENEQLKATLTSGHQEYENDRKQLSAKLRDYHAINSERDELKQLLADAEERFANAMVTKEQAVRARDRIVTDIEVMALQMNDPADKASLTSLLEKYQSEGH